MNALAFTPIVILFLFIGVNALAFTPIVFLFLFIIMATYIFFRRFLSCNYFCILCAISTILIPKCSACSGHSCYDFFYFKYLYFLKYCTFYKVLLPLKMHWKYFKSCKNFVLFYSFLLLHTLCQKHHSNFKMFTKD